MEPVPVVPVRTTTEGPETLCWGLDLLASLLVHSNIQKLSPSLITCRYVNCLIFSLVSNREVSNLVSTTRVQTPFFPIVLQAKKIKKYINIYVTKFLYFQTRISATTYVQPKCRDWVEGVQMPNSLLHLRKEVCRGTLENDLYSGEKKI